MTIKYITKDFVRFSYGADKKTTLYWGDKVELIDVQGKTAKIRALELFDGNVEGTVKAKSIGDNPAVMRFSMVDVQQGDGMIFETPPDAHGKRNIMLIDGGDNKLFARHVAARFRHLKSTPQDPLPIDTLLITHGDADHFDGLTQIRRSETERNLADRKRLFIHPKRIYHNGLVKLPSSKPVLDDQGVPVLKANGKPKTKSRPDVEMFGETVEKDGDDFAINLLDDPRDSSVRPLNKYYESWIDTLDHWETRGAIDMKYIGHGMDADALFASLLPMSFELQGPFFDTVTDSNGDDKTALKFFHKPKKSSKLHEGNLGFGGSPSASHTVNGHSISLRISFGNVRFNLTGDHNQESMAMMRSRLNLSELESEIVKAPHHGSADFDYDVLEAMSPVVSIISSGDESARKEHVHPRATLMAALGRVSRTKTSILLSTELVSFFAMRDYAHTREDLTDFFRGDDDVKIPREDLEKAFKTKVRDWTARQALPDFFAFERTNFGIIHVRTDGERVLVFTHTGKKLGHEAYAFRVDANHDITFETGATKG